MVTLNAALLQSPKARRCGGRRSPVTEAKAKVLSSSEKRLRMRIQMPPPRFVSHQVGGKDFLELAMEGMDVSGDVGKPGLPMKSTFFAIPEGANVDIDVSNVKSYTIQGVELYPLQEQPVDQRPPDPEAASRHVPRAAVRAQQQGLRLEGEVPVRSGRRRGARRDA